MDRATAPETGSTPSRRVRLAWDPRMLAYRFGPHHPFDQRSRALAVELIGASLASQERTALENVPAIEPEEEAVLRAFHRPAYLGRVRAASDAGDRRPLDSGDTPSFPGCFDASARVVAATVGSMREAIDHRRWSFAPAGGLHHAGPERASGFCIFNDLGVAIAQAVSRGRRVAYLDLDAHHGDGVMYGFYGDGRVLDIDIHQDGRTLFPGTGSVHETGVGDGAGLKVNLPLPPGTGDEALVPLLGRIVPPMLEQFRPEVVVLQHGVDGHWGDPLAQLQYTPSGYDAIDALVVSSAEAVGASLIVTGGGGYRPASVARTLARAARAAARLPVPPTSAELPSSWRGSFAAAFGGVGPGTWGETPRLSPSPWSPARTDRLVHDLEERLGRRFPNPGPTPPPDGEA